MFLLRDLSRDNLKKQANNYASLRTCTSEKKFSVAAPPAEYLRVGQYKYREQDLLGKGFSSKVYKATNINNSDQKYAIKVINLRKFKSSNLAMLENQIEVHRSLSHPNVVQFYDAYKTDSNYYIITEYCPHGDLMELVAQKKRLDQPKAQAIIQQIIEGYNYLSQKSVLHRDLKPANIFRSGETWKIGDFGFALFCRSESMVDKINVGTPLYMPLESLRSNKYSCKSDIFSIGIMLYELVTGRTPWDCKTEKQLVNKMKTEQINYSAIRGESVKKFIQRSCEMSENLRMDTRELASFFSVSPSTSIHEQKASEIKSLKSVLSMKSIKDESRNVFGSPNKVPVMATMNTMTSLKSNKTIHPSGAFQTSTEVSEEEESNKVKVSENYKQKNTKLILQELQFCRQIYYITKNAQHLPIQDAKAKSFLNLVLFKHLLRCIKQLEEPQKHFGSQLISFQMYQAEKEYKKLDQEIRNYSRRYEKQYLDVLKNTEISVIRQVNREFPELSYNSALGLDFYSKYQELLLETVRGLNHSISLNLNREKDAKNLFAQIQALDSFCSYYKGVENKMTAYQLKKQEVLVPFSSKVVMDYKMTRASLATYEELRHRIRNW